MNSDATAQEEIERLDALRRFERDWPLNRDATRAADDGRGDEDHPDSGWVETFNAGQRGDW